MQWRQQVAAQKVARFREQTYWGRPVPGFGDPQARLLVVGLAPAAHGGNRTGRVFTGDASGDWLFRALHRAGFANQPGSVDRDDGLELQDCYLTAVVRCAPPDNRPTPAEARQCRPYLSREISLLPRLRAVVALGRFAFDHCRALLGGPSSLAFGHNLRHTLANGIPLIASYHPSQRNTSTKLLTEAMLDEVFWGVRQVLD